MQWLSLLLEVLLVASVLVSHSKVKDQLMRSASSTELALSTQRENPAVNLDR